MNNVASVLLVSLFISGCGTAGRIGNGRNSIAEFPGRSDMYLVERKVKVLKSNVSYAGDMLSRMGTGKWEEQIKRISDDSRILRQLVDRISVEMQDLVFKLEEQERIWIKEKDDKTLLRMKSLIIPELQIGSGKSLQDATAILSDAARHPRHGDAMEIEFDLEDAVVGLSDEGKQEDSSGVIEDEEKVEDANGHECPYKPVPIITASDISLYDALMLICESVECRWDLRDGKVYLSLVAPTEFHMRHKQYPAPLLNPDRDWIGWLSARGIHLPQNSTVIYDKYASRLEITTTSKGIEIFENAFPLIYSGKAEN